MSALVEAWSIYLVATALRDPAQGLVPGNSSATTGRSSEPTQARSREFPLQPALGFASVKLGKL